MIADPYREFAVENASIGLRGASFLQYSRAGYARTAVSKDYKPLLIKDYKPLLIKVRATGAPVKS
jgi:hypothetical protein